MIKKYWHEDEFLTRERDRVGEGLLLAYNKMGWPYCDIGKLYYMNISMLNDKVRKVPIMTPRR